MYEPDGHEAATHVEPTRRYPCDALHVNPVCVALTVPFAGGLEHVVAFPIEYVPVGHVVHDVAPAIEYVPAEHVVHDDAPAAEYVPAEHVVHDDANSPAYVPAEHVVHDDAPAVEYVPAEHAVQANAPADEDDPAGHKVHDDDDEPGKEEYDPAGHKVHDNAPAVEYCPLGQFIHPFPDPYCPAGHERVLHTDAPVDDVVPPGHAVHDVAFVVELYVFTGHAVHVPDDDTYVPAGHGVHVPDEFRVNPKLHVNPVCVELIVEYAGGVEHDAEPEYEYCPDGQDIHVELFAAPVFAEYVPAEHGRHVPEY